MKTPIEELTELKNWRELGEALRQFTIPPEKRTIVLWPNRWHEECHQVAFVMHTLVKHNTRLLSALAGLVDETDKTKLAGMRDVLDHFNSEPDAEKEKVKFAIQALIDILP